MPSDLTRAETTELFLASAVFALTAAGWLRYGGSGSTATNQRRTYRTANIEIIDPSVGARGHAALTPSIPYLSQFLSCLQNQCDPLDNPMGYIPLCVAENRLVLDMLAERFMQPGTSTAIFSDSHVYCYNSFLGMPVAREAAAYFLARRFLYPNSHNLQPDQALAAVRPQHVALGAGAAAILNTVFYLLGDEGDACLIPRPFYAAFETDLTFYAGVEPVGIEQTDPVMGPTVEELERAYKLAETQGYNPKFILITNPNNPLGTVYSPEVLRRIVKWARKKKMHTIVDEIYALGVHEQHGHGFESIIKVLDNELGDDVHMLWAVSKDFGASGLRVGLVYSCNQVFMEGLATANIFGCVSQPIQYLVSELLTDDPFLDRFFEEARHRTVHSYQICTRKLDEMVVPYVHAAAGLFVYVDFSSLLPEKTFAGEKRLSELMFEYARVVLTPGESQRETTPGMFRICYAWVAPNVLEIAMERLSRLVAKIRRLDFNDLNERSLGNVITIDSPGN